MEATELGRRRRRRRCSCCSDYIVFCEEISSSPPSWEQYSAFAFVSNQRRGIQLKGTKELIEDSQEIHRSRDLIQSVIRRSRYQVGPLETKGCGWFNRRRRRNKTLQRVELIEAPNSSASTSTPWEGKGRGCWSIVLPSCVFLESRESNQVETSGAEILR